MSSEINEDNTTSASAENHGDSNDSASCDSRSGTVPTTTTSATGDEAVTATASTDTSSGRSPGTSGNDTDTAGDVAVADGTSSTTAVTSSTTDASITTTTGPTSMTLRTLQQYRLMASDPEKVAPLTRDGTVAQFLAYVLEDRDEAIVAEALHTIVLLCRADGSRRQLARTYGLIPALQCLKMKDSGAEVLALADQALGELKRPVAAPVGAASASSSVSPTSREKPRLPPRPKHKVVTLHVTGLVTENDRDELESLLVRVRGMISIVFDMGRGRCTCRVRDNVTVGTLGSAVDRTDAMAAYQVVRGVEGEADELVPVSKRARALERPREEKLPEYLPEEDGDEVPGEGAVAPGGFFKQASGWLSSASSYLSQSFYW